MGPHRRNSHDDTPAHGGAVGHDLAGLKFDRLNGPWPCAAPKGCLYNNGSNAEHIMITQEDLRSEFICTRIQDPILPESPVHFESKTKSFTLITF
jgi:hypothetical protein